MTTLGASCFLPTFMAGSLPRTPFRTLVPAVAKAGFHGMNLWPNIWQHALRRDGLTLADMRRRLDDHGLVLTDIDAYRDWVPPPSADDGRFGPTKAGVPLGEILDVGAALGASTIVAVHLSDAPADRNRDIAAFADLCDAAAAYDMRVALEFIAFSDIADAASAWAIVSAAGRANGGLVVDLWHHVRGSGRGDDGLIAAIPADRIFTVQYCDGPRRSDHPLVEEAMYFRRMPGEGSFDIAGFLAMLASMGVKAPCGPELYRRDFAERRPEQVIAELARAHQRVLARLASSAAAGQ